MNNYGKVTSIRRAGRSPGLSRLWCWALAGVVGLAALLGGRQSSAAVLTSQITSTGAITVPGFDPALGTLTGVQLRIEMLPGSTTPSGTHTIHIPDHPDYPGFIYRLTSLSGEPDRSFAITVPTVVNGITIPGFTVFTTPDGGITFGGFAAPSQYTVFGFASLVPSRVTSRSFSGDDLAHFTGEANLYFPVGTLNTGFVTTQNYSGVHQYQKIPDDGNVWVSPRFDISATIDFRRSFTPTFQTTATFEFTPTVPEPSSWIIVTGLAIFAAAGRRLSRRSGRPR